MRAAFLTLAFASFAAACGGPALPSAADGGARNPVVGNRVWLPSARVGAPYDMPLPYGLAGPVAAGAWPLGLGVTSDRRLSGTPTRAGQVSLVVGGAEGAMSAIDLTVFPADVAAGRTVDARVAGPSPFAAAARETTYREPSMPAPRRVRLVYPTSDGGRSVAPGRHPLVVFQHGAGHVDAAHPALYDRYDALLTAWASDGFVVASIDGLDHVLTSDGGVVASSIEDLRAMSDDQRALLRVLRAPGGDAAVGLRDALDLSRVVVAGHSRGGGAALLTASAEADVVASVLIKPVDPMVAEGGAVAWSGALPDKPMLIFLAGSDGELPGPMVEYLFERRSAPAVATCIVGSAHAFSADAAWLIEPGVPAPPTIRREDDWAVTNAWTRAFLAWTVRGEIDAAVALFGPGGLSTTSSPAGVLVESDAAFAGVLIDDFAHLADVQENALGEPTDGTGLLESIDEAAVDDDRAVLPGDGSIQALYDTPEARRRSSAHRLEWARGGGRYVQELGGIDARPWGTLALRARTPMGRAMSAADVLATFIDSAGARVSLSFADHTGRAALADRYSNVVFPLAEIAAAQVDLATLARVELELRGTGSLIIDDLRLE